MKKLMEHANFMIIYTTLKGYDRIDRPYRREAGGSSFKRPSHEESESNEVYYASLSNLAPLAGIIPFLSTALPLDARNT